MFYMLTLKVTLFLQNELFYLYVFFVVIYSCTLDVGIVY